MERSMPQKGPVEGQSQPSTAHKGSFQSQPPPPAQDRTQRDQHRRPRTTNAGPRTSQDVARPSRAASDLPPPAPLAPLVERPVTRPAPRASAARSIAMPPPAPPVVQPAARARAAARPAPAAALSATAMPRHTAVSVHARSARRAPASDSYPTATAQAEPAARASRTLAAELAEWAASPTEDETYFTPSFSMPSLDDIMDQEILTSPDQDQALLQKMKKVSPECRERAALILREQIVAMGCAKAGDAEYCAQDRQSSQVLNLDAEVEAMLAQITSASQPFYHQTPSRRPRPDTDSDEEDAEAKRQRLTGATSPTPPSETYQSEMEEDECVPVRAVDRGTKRASPTYAETTRAAAPSPPTASNPCDAPQPPTPQAKKPIKVRYPPLIVDDMPNWAHHFRTIKKSLGRAPNARPYGKGIKFNPQEDHEYRLIQRYLTSLEQTEKLSWFSYSLPTDRSLKVAVRGLPANTDPEDIILDLKALGFDPEFARQIRARKGRPGCIFLVVLRRTPHLTPAIYDVDELLCMPGVTIESWRGKRGPAQCHRCQKFRHSSHNCHRQQACVRCGGEHSAHECQRPLEEPATCANCEGPHPANHVLCPTFRKEARNKRVGTTAATTQGRPKPTDEVNPGQGANIRTPANEPKTRGGPPSNNKKRRPRRKRKDTTAKESIPTNSKGESSTATLQVAIDTLKKVLEALMEGKNVTSIITEGLKILTAQECR